MKSKPSAKASPVKFDSAVVVKKLLGEVPERARDVLVRRFGLGANAERETLEAIGDRSEITRERVRQIEAAGLEAVRARRALKETAPAFEELRKYVEHMGVVVPEEELLAGLGKDEKTRNRFRFLLGVGSSFF